MSKKIVAGIVGDVTAYAYAKAGGYTGTEEEFQALMAANVEAAKYADEVMAAAAEAKADKEDAEESKTAAAASQADAATSKAAAETAANYARTYTGAPRVAATAAAMTDQSLIYVYTGSETGYTAGNWYFWDGTTWTSGGVYNSTALETDETLTVSGAAADAKVTGDEIGALKSAIDYLENYAYTNVVNKTVVLSSNPFIALDTTLSSGKTYQINLQFKNITNNNLSKMTAIRLYKTATSTSEYEDITFSVAYNQMQENIVYTAFVTPSINATCILIGFNSAASFSTDNVVINVNDMSAKFANKAVESIANNAYEALKKTIGFGDIHFTNGFFQKPDGTTSELASFMISDFIPVVAGLSMTYFIHGYNNVAAICIFKSDQTTVTRNVHPAVESDLEGNLTFEAGEAYIRFCRWSTSKGSGDTLSMQTIMAVASEIQRIDSEISVIGETQWQGKIWHCFGTSISNTNNVGKYPTYLAALSGLQYVNKGYDGGRIIQEILNTIKADSSIASADLITVEGFVNDWSQQSPLGAITDTTADTFCGAIYDAITYILAHSTATLVFITDSTGQNYNNIDIRRQAVRNGKTQNDFIQATVDMCNYMGVPVIDAGRKSCISQDTATLYLADQIHQTEKGGEQYARTIWAELKNIKPRIV